MSLTEWALRKLKPESRQRIPLSQGTETERWLEEDGALTGLPYAFKMGLTQ